MLPHQSTQPPSLNLEPAGCETIIYRLKRLRMAEDTYELRLEQEGFHIIPVQGGEVRMWRIQIQMQTRVQDREKKELSIKLLWIRLTCMELEGKSQCNFYPSHMELVQKDKQEDSRSWHQASSSPAPVGWRREARWKASWSSSMGTPGSRISLLILVDLGGMLWTFQYSVQMALLGPTGLRWQYKISAKNKTIKF